MARKVAFRKKRQNRLAMILVSVVVGMLFVVLLVSMTGLKKKQNSYIEREQILLDQIEREQARSEELVEYVEEVAKDTLELVYGDEIIFESDDGK